MQAEPQAEHKWLDQLVGNWTFETEAMMGPDQPPMKFNGSEVVRSLGGLWTLAEGQSEMPDGGMGTTLMTLGYDPQQKRFIGTFIGSMMTYLWIYSGSLDSTGKVLTLDAQGPSFTGTGMANFQDIVEVVNADHRILKSQMQSDDGTWMHFMTAHYHRTK